MNKLTAADISYSALQTIGLERTLRDGKFSRCEDEKSNLFGQKHLVFEHKLFVDCPATCELCGEWMPRHKVQRLNVLPSLLKEKINYNYSIIIFSNYNTYRKAAHAMGYIPRNGNRPSNPLKSVALLVNFFRPQKFCFDSVYTLYTVDAPIRQLHFMYIHTYT